MNSLKLLLQAFLCAVIYAPVMAQASAYPGGAWQPGPEIYGVGEQRFNYVEMDDGTRLRADVFYPTDPVTGEAADGPFPVLLTQTPYSANLQVSNNLNQSGQYFVRRGYIYVVADQRGTGLSGGGEWDMFGYRAGRDGALLADWAADLANQGIANANGVVGLHGCSAMGISQLATAIALGRSRGTDHPVKAMIPGCMSGAQYRDTWFDNGIPGFIVALSVAEAPISLYRWPLLVANGDQPTAIGAEILAGGDLAYERAFWKERNLTDHAPDIVASGIPGLLYVAWSEGGRTTTFEMYAQLQNAWAGRDPHAPMVPGQPVTGRYQLFMGEGGHGCCLGDSGVQLQFYEYWLKGVETGLVLDTSTPMHLQMLADGNYVNAANYPMTDNYTSLRLDERALREVPLAEGSDTLAWAPPQQGLTAHDYDMLPLENGAVLAGPMTVSVYAASSNTNLQLSAAIFDVAPDGTATEISHGSVIGSLAALDNDRSWRDRHGAMIRPYPMFDYDRYLTPGPLNVQRYDVHIMPTLYRVAPGHALRLTLSTQWSPDICAGSAGVGPAPYGCVHTRPQLQTLTGGSYTIYRNARYPSALHVPLLPLDHFSPVAAAATPTSGSTVVPLDWGASIDESDDTTCNRRLKSQGRGGERACR